MTPQNHAFSWALHVQASLSPKMIQMQQSSSMSVCEKNPSRSHALHAQVWVHGWMIDRLNYDRSEWGLHGSDYHAALHTAPLWAMDWLHYTVRRGRSASSISISKTMEEGWCPQWGYQPLRFSWKNFIWWSLPEKRCHMACVKGNNYLLEFLGGFAQFKIIIQSLRVINRGIILKSIWYVSFPFNSHY